ncbi:MAG: type II toxin-antitoxin system PemK/MazF family toxin [Syntrophales bacterium]
MAYEKGDVYRVNFDPAAGSEVKKIRPAVIVSNDVNNANSPILSIAPITSNVSRVFSFEVELPSGSSGLAKKSKAMVNQTRAVDKARLIEHIGKLDRQVLDRIDRALKLHYDLD